MNLNTLQKIKDPTIKRLGRGLGSGKGKTSGRGQKGRKARGKVPAAAVGGGLILYKKLPFRRGMGNRKVSAKVALIKTSQLNALKPQTVVNLTTLIELNLVNKKDLKKGVKVLADVKLDRALTVEIPVSENVRQMIESSGGKVVVL
jgi:large subunit ribosomal protein L15